MKNYFILLKKCLFVILLLISTHSNSSVEATGIKISGDGFFQQVPGNITVNGLNYTSDMSHNDQLVSYFEERQTPFIRIDRDRPHYTLERYENNQNSEFIFFHKTLKLTTGIRHFYYKYNIQTHTLNPLGTAQNDQRAKKFIELVLTESFLHYLRNAR